MAFKNIIQKFQNEFWLIVVHLIFIKLSSYQIEF